MQTYRKYLIDEVLSRRTYKMYQLVSHQVSNQERLQTLFDNMGSMAKFTRKTRYAEPLTDTKFTGSTVRVRSWTLDTGVAIHL